MIQWARSVGFQLVDTILIDAACPDEVRVALVDEAGSLLCFESARRGRLQERGNIYLGRIYKVEPSLQAVFVECDKGKSGFLPSRRFLFTTITCPKSVRVLC